MAIETQFDPNDYAKTALLINGEFITTYISGVDITYMEPTIDENSPFTRPIIWLEYYGDNFSDIGMGRVLNNNQNGQIGRISFWAWFYLPTDQGVGECFTLGSKIKNIYLQHQSDLATAGIKHSQVGSLRTFEEDSIFIGGRQLITMDVLLSWNK